MTIKRVLVANRGEIARRIFRTCRDLGIETVAVYSDADAGMPFVAEADVSVRLPGSAPSDTYLRGDLVIEAARRSGADAIHPGYGFLSENAGFARDVESAGLVWIGPSPESIDQMGSKIRAKEIMAAAGVPILAVDLDGVTPGELPLLVKASAGGGGRGMRVVEQLDDLDAELAKARAEAESAFGDGTVFVEPYLPRARHVEVQILADTHGTVWAVGDRDCSIQRRHQKVVEEAPAPGLSDRARTTLHIAAREAAKAVSYRGAGTVEFLVDGDRVFFLEMNTRLQVEHPVTEEVHGLDLVAEQIRIAEGGALTGTVREPNGHAIEVRLYAEDPAEDWSPQTGTIRAFDFPDSVRVDSAVEVGSVVGIHYDAMIAKVIAHGPDRATALRTLVDALRRSRVHGVTTNRSALRQILEAPQVRDADLWTSMLEEHADDWFGAETPDSLVPVAAALAEATLAASSARVLSRIPAGFRNVPSQPLTREYEGHEPVAYRSAQGRLVVDGADVVSVAVDGSTVEIMLEVEGVTRRYRVAVAPGHVDVDGPDGSTSLVPVPRFVDPADVVAEGSLLAPMPAAVTAVKVADGDRVAKGDPVVVLEAMKMQHTIAAPSDGVVSGLAVSVGQQVEAGAVLAVIEEETE
ncbi:biotin/lipoyl-binding protein [Aeromicrobium sp. Marseille-Q0843]|uniref:Biotin/lipoyl-binding protein n=1 Tax=Aeromicrobium phoceense TaxID=2754045 RepID=A0A838XCL7_9ACTN|nr:biotin carboxylase N-terminal domain-containing protein [Aeromicrobium phoceense]MBA4607662.1 biotin/lipoyl-binding protein [Aeromicrobium phoceense]